MAWLLRGALTQIYLANRAKAQLQVLKRLFLDREALPCKDRGEPGTGNKEIRQLPAGGGPGGHEPPVVPASDSDANGDRLGYEDKAAGRHIRPRVAMSTGGDGGHHSSRGVCGHAASQHGGGPESFSSPQAASQRSAIRAVDTCGRQRAGPGARAS